MSSSVCAWIERDEVFEDYVRGALRPEDHDAFEAHYFECAACFDRLQTSLALRAELAELPAELRAVQPAPGWPWRWVLVPLVASVVVVAVAALWFRAPALPNPAPTWVQAPATQTPPSPPPTAAAGGIPSRPQAPSVETPPVVALSVLARAEPPLYVPLALRGPRDDAAEKFDAAMRLYAGGDYTGAIPGLRAASELRPGAPQTTFFLAVCQLLTGDSAAAAAGLERTIGLGDSPYLEEAHFYLAKARLRQGRVPDARTELQQTINRHGSLEQEARQLLTALRDLQAK